MTVRPLPAVCPQRSASSSVRTAGAASASTSASVVWLHRHSVSDPSVYPCCYSSPALSVKSVSIPLLLLFTGTQCQIRQYTLAVGYSSLALSVRSVSIPLLLVTLHWHSVSDPSVYPCCYSFCHASHCGPSVTSHASILYIMLSFTLVFLVLFSHSEL